MIGLSSNRVELHEHNAAWSCIFDEERTHLQNAVGETVLDIQHVGSTSIPAIPAKPIIDIAIAVENFEEATRCIEPLIELGYEYKGENGIPRRHYFCKGPPEAGTHHLHMNEAKSADWMSQIAFRDYLRANPALAGEYAAVKRQLAEEFPNDRMAYTECKTGIIGKIMTKALPDILPTIGQEITGRTYKWDRTCYRWWQATVVEVTDETIVTQSMPGNTVFQPTENWISQYGIRTTYWFDRPYNLLEVRNPDGSLLEIYVNIASPLRLKGNELHFTDYELDVVMHADQAPEIVDQDEFAEATEKFGYSEAFQAHCWEAADEAVELARSWKV